MNYSIKRINNTDCHIFAANPEDGILTLRKYGLRKTIKSFEHGWWENEGYKEVAALNATYFDWSGGTVGGCVVDGGFYVSAFLTDEKFVTLIYKDQKLILDESCDYDYLINKYKGFNFIVQLGDPLIKSGKSYKGDGEFDHSYGSHPRTFIGQKKDGQLIMFATDGRGGDDKGFTSEELRQAALDLGCETAVMCDGGGSSTLLIEEEMVNTNENRKVPTAFMFYAKPGYELETEKEKTANKIAIGAGHGMGTAGKRTPEGIREAQQNYPVMFKLNELLVADPEFDVMMVNTNMAYDMPLNTRTNLANNWGADMYLSIHKDAYGDGSWRDDVGGITSLVYSQTSDSYNMGKIIQSHLVAASGINDRGISLRPGLAVLKNTRMPSVLVELGFMTNRSEAAQMYSAAWVDLYAKALYKGIKEIFK